jgi:putative DNA-invertase from lambdoid prophage Rac
MTDTTLSPPRPAGKRRRPRTLDRPPMIYGYCRVSTVGQTDGTSLDEQHARIRGKALSEGWEVTRVYADTCSGSVPLSERPQGAVLMQALEAGDIVVVSKLDRLFRSAPDALTVVRDFHERGIHLYLLDIGGDDVSGNGVSRMMLQLLAVFAEFERSRISERILEGKRRLRVSGRHQGGKRPFGWRPMPREEGGKAPMLEPIPEEQAVIGEIRRMREEGAPLRAIAAAMRDRGFPLSPETIRNILRRATDASSPRS